MGSHGDVKIRNEKFASYVKNHPLEPISSNDIAKQFNCSKSTIGEMWKNIPAVLGGKVEGKPGLGFIWTPPYECKNAEGYADPTATKAINNVVKSTKSSTISEGEIRIHSGISGKLDYIYIVKVFDKFTLALPIYKDDGSHAPGEFAYPVEIPGSADSWYMDISRISTRQSKYTEDVIASLGVDVYGDVIAGLRDIFGYETPDDADTKELEAKLDKMTKNYVHEKNEHQETYKKLMAIDKEVTDIEKENTELRETVSGLKESIRMRDVRIFELTKRIAEMEAANTQKLDKKAEIEMKVMQARLDIYEKELFGGEA